MGNFQPESDFFRFLSVFVQRMVMISNLKKKKKQTWHVSRHLMFKVSLPVLAQVPHMDKFLPANVTLFALRSMAFLVD